MNALQRTIQGLKMEVDRCSVAISALENLGLEHVPASFLVEIGNREERARDLADLIEMTGVRAGHLAEGTRFEGLKP